MKPKHLLPSLALFTLSVTSASAQIANWIGTTDNWNTGSNWSTGSVPTQDAVFNSSGTNQFTLKLTANSTIRSMYLFGGNYTLSPTTAEVLTVASGGFTQMGSGTFTINNNITTTGDLAFTGTGSGAITLNGTISNGASRWDKWNESNVTLTNAYTTTNVNTIASSGSAAAMRVRAGSLILSGAGSITQGAAAHITLGAPATYSAGAFINNANAALILDNTGTNNTNRVTDTNQINISNRALIEFRGNALAASTETLGTLNSAGGAGSQIRVKSAGGQSAWLTFAGITTGNGAITIDTNGNPTVFQFLVPTGDTLGAAGTAGGRVIFTAAPTLTNGVMRYGVVKDETTNGGATFATYDTTVDNGQALGVTGLASGAYTTTTLSGATNLQNVNATDNITLSAASAVNALRINTTTAGQTLTMGTNTLTIGSATAAQSAGGFIFNGGNDYVINNTSGTGVTFAGSTYTYVNSNTLTINAPVVRNGEFTKAGDGALVITGSFNNGSTRHLAVDDGAATDDLSINGVISSANVLHKAGQGALVLGGATSNSGFTGGVNLNAGKIVLNKDTALLQNTALGSGAFAWQGGTIEARGSAAVIANTVNLGTQGSAGSGNQMTGNQAITFSGLVQGAADTAQTYPVVNNASADLTLSGTTIRAHTGTLSVNRAGILEFSGSGTTKVTGSVVDYSNNGFTGTTAIAKSGSGLLILSGPNTYTGSTTVNAGYLRLDHASALGAANLAIIEANYAGGQNAVVELGTGNTSFVRAIGTAAGQVNLGGTSGNSFNNGGFASVTGTSTVNLGGAGAAVTWGATGFFQAGGALILGSPNVAGTVNFQNAIILNGSRTIRSLNGGAAIDGILSGAITAAPSGATTTFTFDGDGTIDVTGVISSAATTGSTGTTLIKNGTGTVILSNNNTYTGANSNGLPANGTRINAGTLGIKSDLSLGLTGGGAFQQILFTGSGTLQDTANNISLSSFRTIGINTGAVATFDSNGNIFTINGIIQNNSGNTASGIAKSGAGTVVLTGANTYSGTTTISAGTLSVQNGSAIADTSAVTLANVSGATLNINTGETIGSLAGGGTTGGAVTLNTNGLTLGGDNTSTSFGGIISGSGISNSVGLVKQGIGTFTLTGANTYTQDTYAVGGTLAFSGGGNVNSSIIRLGETSGTNGATLSITDAAGGNAIASTIVVRPGSSGTKTISATNTSGTSTFSGSVFLDDSATATSTNSGATLAFTGSQLDLKNKNLLVNGAGNTTISNVISNTGGSATTGTLQKAGAGTLVLSGANTFTGQVSIDAGTIRVDTTPASTGGTIFLGNGVNPGTSGSLLLGGVGGSGGGVTVANSIAINPGSINNRTLGGVNTSGTTNTFSGTTFTNGGDLTITSTNSGANLAFTNASALDLKGQNVLINGAGNTQISGAIYNSAGSGSVTKQGAGIATFSSSSNTYSGGTTVSVGTLLANNTSGSATGSGTLAVSGATLGGSGIISGAATLTAATLAPGSAAATAGTITLGAGLALNSSSIFEWDMQQAATTDPGAAPAAGGTNAGTYDRVVLNGTANSLTGSGAIFKIILGGGKTFADAFWDTDKTWNNIFTGSGVATNLASIFSTFNANGSNLTVGLVAGEGTFTVNGSSTVNWTAVPEPSSALVGLLLATGLLRRRRA